MLLERGQRGEWPRFFLAQHARLLERVGGGRAARIGIDRQRERVGDGLAKVDRGAVVEQSVEVAAAEFQFLLGRGHDGGGNETQVEGLVDMRRDRLAAGDAGLGQGRLDPARDRHRLAIAAKHRVGVEAVERQQPEPPGDRGALSAIGNEVDPLAAANSVERQPMRELAHFQCPSRTAASLAPPSDSDRRRSDSAANNRADSSAGSSR